MTSLGETAYVGALHYDTLVPPVGGGTQSLQDVCNIGNTTTTAITCGDVTCSTANVNDKIVITQRTDNYPVDKKTIYNERIIDGSGNQQTGAGQDNFSSVATDFPTSIAIKWMNGFPQGAIQGIIGRRTGVTLAPGTIGNQIGYGTKAAFQDSVFYDPLQLRYAPTNPNSFSAVRFGDNCVGWNGVGLQMKMMVYTHVHLEGTWTGTNNNNDLKVFIRHFDPAGVLRRDYQLLRIAGKASAPVVESADRLIMGFAPYGEDINGNDYFEVWMDVDVGSPDSFTISLFKAVIEIKAVP